MCWLHFLRLMMHAYGCLLDLTGREYPRRARRVFIATRSCSRCAAKRIKKFGSDPYEGITDPTWPWSAIDLKETQ